MIANLPQNVEIPSFLKFLVDSPVVFYLTGSRFFGTHHDMSDWDFFCLPSDDAYNLLIKEGFKTEKGKSRYKDPLTIAVMELQKGIDLLLSGKKAHVQLVSDVDMKCRVQRMISDMGLYEGMSKEEMSTVWTTLIRMEMHNTLNGRIK